MSNQQRKENVEERDCEKCGEPTGEIMVGDETYSYCKNCNWTTH